MDRSMARRRRKLTYEDYVLIPDDGRRHEIIDGEHFVTPSLVTRHQAILRNLLLELGPEVRERGLGQLHLAPLDVILSESDVVQPDLLFVRRERQAIIGDWVRGAPDLAVEILSPGTRRRDDTVKRSLYESHGVSEYWIVDPKAEAVEVCRLADGEYARPERLLAQRGDTLASPLLGGIRLELRRVFRS